MSRRPRLLRAATALVVCLVGARARGAPARPDVAVLRPAVEDPVLVEASARLRLELGASGMTSALVDDADDAPTRVAFVRVDGLATIDVLGARPDGSPAHRRVPVRPDEGGDDPSVLAVRAVELLRGIRLELGLAPAPAPAAPPPAREPDLVEAPPAEPRAWRLGAGVSALEARPYAAARAFAPSLMGAVAFMGPVSLVGLVAGPFSTERPPTPVGSAHTREELALVGFLGETRRPRVNIHATFAAGLHHLTAAYDDRGLVAGTPTQFHFFTPQAAWTPVVALTAGASARLGRRVGAALELTALVAQPALEIVASERALGTIGGPSLMQTLWAWVAFP